MTNGEGAKILQLYPESGLSPDAAEDALPAGLWLKTKREEKGVSASEISARTHISEKLIRALEELDFRALPTRAYVLGFVRSYCSAIDIDADEGVNRFKAGFATRDARVLEKSHALPKAPEPRLESREMSLVAVIGILVFAVWCAWAVTKPREIKELNPQAAEAINAPAVFATPPENPAPTPVQSLRIEPVYPIGCLPDARDKETVLIEFAITPGGRVVSERVLETSNPCFDKAALNAVRRWRYETESKDGPFGAYHGQLAELDFYRPG